MLPAGAEAVDTESLPRSESPKMMMSLMIESAILSREWTEKLSVEVGGRGLLEE